MKASREFRESFVKGFGLYWLTQYREVPLMESFECTQRAGLGLHPHPCRVRDAHTLSLGGIASWGLQDGGCTHIEWVEPTANTYWYCYPRRPTKVRTLDCFPPLLETWSPNPSPMPSLFVFVSCLVQCEFWFIQPTKRQSSQLTLATFTLQASLSSSSCSRPLVELTATTGIPAYGWGVVWFGRAPAPPGGAHCVVHLHRSLLSSVCWNVADPVE